VNQFIATVTRIDRLESLNLITLHSGDETLEMLTLELDDRIAAGSRLALTLKATNIILSPTSLDPVGSGNQIRCTVRECEYGEILCAVKLETLSSVLEAIVTARYARSVGLQSGDVCYAHFNPAALGVSEVLDD